MVQLNICLSLSSLHQLHQFQFHLSQTFLASSSFSAFFTCTNLAWLPKLKKPLKKLDRVEFSRLTSTSAPTSNFTFVWHQVLHHTGSSNVFNFWLDFVHGQLWGNFFSLTPIFQSKGKFPKTFDSVCWSPKFGWEGNSKCCENNPKKRSVISFQ